MSKPTRIASETSEVSVASFPTRNRNKNIRKPAKEPLRPIGLRFEYMTEQKTHLTLYPGGSAVSECAYSIQDENGAVLFTVSGRRCSPHYCREVRDQSGLPLFEIHQRSRWVRNTWTVSLPGCRTTPIAIGRHSLGGDLHLELENLIQVDCNVKERNLPIDLESHGRVLTMYDVVDDNRRIMEIKESIRHNKKLALLSFCQAGYRPAMDMVIMPGMDMATAVAIAVIVSASSFPAHRSC
ncbi:Tubby C-terminal-like domain [Penicillium roqueforti FM164]|uniref:Tubby C-terminal-like domain n=1 Tax=Penicillium roqueforti (strain FM164) TaxID=1365484 RepID=W6QNK1_PENRF|nr:Tubby C-terminal-like domain [Penicillium roqueforti FM164]